MKNYFNYFTEIEEHFQRRRGSLLLLSTLDWALIDSWREAGLPLEAVLRGIDAAFDKYDARKQHARVRKVNGLAWCAQAVMQAVEEMQEASVGMHKADDTEAAAPGLERERVAAHLLDAAGMLGRAALPGMASTVANETAQRLTTLAADVQAAGSDLEALERTLTVLEEKLFAALTASVPEQVLVDLRAQAQRELAPYRSRMQAVQIRQIEQQFLHKRVLETYSLPRLSLFYMSQA